MALNQNFNRFFKRFSFLKNINQAFNIANLNYLSYLILIIFFFIVFIVLVNFISQQNKDEKNNWLSPDEVISIDGEKFLKKDQSQKVITGSSESMSKSKKNTIDPEQMIQNYVRIILL